VVLEGLSSLERDRLGKDILSNFVRAGSIGGSHGLVSSHSITPGLSGTVFGNFFSSIGGFGGPFITDVGNSPSVACLGGGIPLLSVVTEFVHVSFVSVGSSVIFFTVSESSGNSGSGVPDFGGFEISNIAEGRGSVAGSGGELDASFVSIDVSTGESVESNTPLLMGEVLEPGPDLFLGSGNTSEGAIWALIDWSSSGKGFLEVAVVPAGLEEEDDDHDVEDGESDKAETEYLSTSEGSDETLMD